MSARWERLAHAGGALAVIRLAAVPVLSAAERLADHPQAHTQPFGPVPVVLGLYALAVVVAALRGRTLVAPAVLAAADVVLVAALVRHGRGIDPARAPGAAARAHRAATCAERVEAIGGEFGFASGPVGRGTQVRVSRPAPVRAARLSERRSAIFGTTALTPGQLAIGAGLALAILLIMEIEKALRRRTTTSAPHSTASPPTLPSLREAPPGPLDDPGTRRSFGSTLTPAFTARVTKPLSERGGRVA